MMWIALALVCVSGCLAEVSFPEVCPALATKPDVDVPKFMGVWYEAEKYLSKDEVTGKCAKANYVLNADGTVAVDNTNINAATGAAESLKGVATFLDKADNSKVNVVFTVGKDQVESPYWVIDTDYENWALAWSCKNSGTTSNRNIWIYTRARNPAASVLEEAYRAAEKSKISKEHFAKTNQENCPDA